MRPFATQLSATPPAIARCVMPVSAWANLASFSIASSVKSWTDRARSISRWVRSDSISRGGPPTASSKRRPVIVRPSQ